MAFNLQDASGITLAVPTSATTNISALSGAATTYTVTNVNAILNGIAQFKATAAGAATPTTDGNTGVAFPSLAANQAAAFVWALDSSGTVKVYKGPTVSWTDTTANSTACPLPAVPTSVVPIAAHTVQNGSTGSAWTFGSSNWNATGISSITVRQLGQLQNAPLLTT